MLIQGCSRNYRQIGLTFNCCTRTLSSLASVAQTKVSTSGNVQVFVIESIFINEVTGNVYVEADEFIDIFFFELRNKD